MSTLEQHVRDQVGIAGHEERRAANRAEIVRDEVDLHRDALALYAAVAVLVPVYQFSDRDRICCHDISATQCHALGTLVECAPMRLSALADRVFLDSRTTSRVVGTQAGFAHLSLYTAGRALCRACGSDRYVWTG